MLKIKASSKTREEVRALTAEFMSEMFHELKGDLAVLDARVDSLVSEFARVQKSLLTDERLAEAVDGFKEHMSAKVDKMQEDVRTAIENLEAQEVAEMNQRLEYVEERLGI